MTDTIKKWVVKWNKTNPKLIIDETLNKDYMYIIFERQRDGSICLGRVKHGMLIRYGVETLVRVSGTISAMWCSSNATESHLMILRNCITCKEINVRDFDFNEIKDVKE